MRPGAMRVESEGSIWFFDDDANEYLRMPKREGPRERGPNGEDWGGPTAGELQDLTWHPMVSWSVGDDRLIIALDDDPAGRVVVAPL